MIRILVFLIFVFALGLGFAWLADRPGDLVITFNGYQYQVSLMVAAVAIVAIVAAVMIVWWLIKAIWNSPYTISRYFRVRRRDRGYQALSTGMIAAGAGDAALARKMNKQAAKLIRLETEPLISLLDAQASLLEGDHEAAREKFERMIDHPQTRLLGLRGLYLEAERLGDRSAARHYAGRAADLAPQLGWAAESTLEEKTSQGDWDGAIRIADAQKPVRAVDKTPWTRRRAVLLTAKAQDLIDTDPLAARAAALEANRLLPAFAPAAIVAARTLFKQNDTRKGAKILETAWKLDPHPEIADLYIHARHGDALHDRLNRARKLQAIKQNHVESALALARAALDAKDYPLARESADTAVRMDPREGAYLLLADIEEAETGDQGRVRQYLSRALRSPRDPAWVADGVVAAHWAPFSPVTGRLDAFEWRIPVERLAQTIEANEPAVPEPRLALRKLEEPVAPLVPAQHIPPEVVEEPIEAGETVLAQPETIDAIATAEVPVTAANDDTMARAGQPSAELPAEPNRLPDDPGVDPDEAAEKAERRFRLF